MKKSLTFILLFVSFFVYSQNSGINFQGVGRNSSGAVLATQKISLRFSVIQGSETGSIEYVESKEVTTNAQGIFSVVIGDGTQISKTGNFTDINWKINPKFLKVEMDAAGGSNFVAMGTTRLQAVPFAYYANGVNADNVDGVLSASKGGTGVASISALKTALAIDQINNTSDLAKPISTATQAVLDTKVEKVDGMQLSTNDFTTLEKTKLAAISGTNTGDQDLSGLATISQLNSKANATDLALKANASDLALKANATDLALKANATDLALKANASDLALKANASDLALKANASDLALKANTSDLALKANASDLALKANTSDLALKAPIESPTFTGTVSGINKAMVGLSLVDNTSDLAKPISALTQAALDTKLSASSLSSTFSSKEDSDNKSIATDLGGNLTSDTFFPTQKAVKRYVDAQINSGGVQDGGILTRHLADGAVNGIKLASEISGFKKFVDGAGSVTLSSTITTDVDVNTGNVALGGTSNWQSFTAGSSGRLSSVEFQTVNPSSGGTVPVAYVEIYNGQGLSGALLGTSANFPISGMGRNWYAFDLSASNISLVSGNIYTARLVVNTSNQNYVYGDNALYNGGISNISSTWDFNIKTKIRQFSNDTFLTTSAANTLYGGLVTNATHTGEVTGATSLTITDGVISTTKMANGAITTAKLADAAVSTAKITDAGVTTAKLNDGAVTGAKLGNNAVDLTTKVTGLLPTINIADAAITTAKITDAAVTTAKLNDGSVTGDKLTNNAVDLTTKVTGLLPTTNIADAAITSAKIANAAVTTAKLNDGSVTGAKLANNAVDLTTKVTGLLPTLNIADAAVTSAIIADAAVTTAKLNDGSVTGAKLANNAVDLTTKVTGLLPTTNIADAAITSAKIADAAVTTVKITDAGITTSKINDGAVTGAKLANSAVNLTTKVTGVLPTSNGGIGTITSTANSFFAGPNGFSGTPSFRSLVASDLPSLTAAYISNNSFSAQNANFNISGNAVIGGTMTTTLGIFSNASVTGTASVGTLSSTQDITVNGIKIGKGSGNIISNIVLGINALSSNTTGIKNIAIGQNSLQNNTLASDNLAFGFQSLYTNTEGQSNIAMGENSLFSNISGGYNMGLGSHSLFRNSTGGNNVAIGGYNLYSNTTGGENIAIGYSNLLLNTLGNSNIALGSEALKSNLTGSNNIALGLEALYTNLSNNNVALGERALYGNTTGNFNVGIGKESLKNNENGDDNIGIGNASLKSNTRGERNVGLGYYTLGNNLTGLDNIALGSLSLYENQDGDSNFAAGYGTLYSNITGDFNIGIGFNALYYSMGNGNIALGKFAGFSTTTGSNNIIIGNDVNASTSNTSNQITLGNGSITSLRAQVTSITALSDRRDKTDIQTISEGIDFIKQLKPVTYTWNTRDKSKVGIKAAGFIAQDLLTLQKTSSIGENLDLVSEDNPEKLEARYNNLLPVMVKAIQDQQAIIDDLKKELEAIKKLIQKP